MKNCGLIHNLCLFSSPFSFSSICKPGDDLRLLILKLKKRSGSLSLASIKIVQTIWICGDQLEGNFSLTPIEAQYSVKAWSEGKASLKWGKPFFKFVLTTHSKEFFLASVKNCTARMAPPVEICLPLLECTFANSIRLLSCALWAPLA